MGFVCLFGAGRNDSGEENVPLDLTRGNAGRPVRGEGALLGRSWTRGRRTRGREPGKPRQGRAPPRGTGGGVRGTAREPGRARLAGPIPLPGARFFRPKSFSGPRECWRARGSPGRRWRSRPPPGWDWWPPGWECRRMGGWEGVGVRQRFILNPGAPAADPWGRPEGGGGCYLGGRRMFEGRETTSCPPRLPEPKPDLAGWLAWG